MAGGRVGVAVGVKVMVGVGVGAIGWNGVRVTVAEGACVAGGLLVCAAWAKAVSGLAGVAFRLTGSATARMKTNKRMGRSGL